MSTSPGGDAFRARIRRLSSHDLTPSEIASIRALMEVAFGSDEEERFTDDDWEHALGALGTGRHSFYERLGWRRWIGPSSVRTTGGASPTPDDDGYIMVLPTRAGSPLDRAAAIICDWRPGDVW